MKKIILIFAIAWIGVLGFNHFMNQWKAYGEIAKLNKKIKNLEFQHSRDSLVIDSLKHQGGLSIVGTDYGKLQPIDTLNFIFNHSEIPEKLVKVE